MGASLAVSGHGIASPGNDTDIFTARNPAAKMAQLRICVSLATGSVLDIRLTDGTNAYSIHLNGGVALTAGVAYTLDFPLSRIPTLAPTTTITYSLRVATTGVIQHLEVWEITEPAS